jgi:hypothetical protein
LTLLDRPADAEGRVRPVRASEESIRKHALRTIDEGRRIFRYDTFGDEAFWGDTLKLHQAIAGAALGGVGPGVSPNTALAVGLKVDADALPGSLKSDLRHGRVNLDDPAVTLALLKLNAVVGVTGFFGNDGKLTSVGLQCAVCHSTVDDSFAPGIGRRLDGWANRDLDVGKVINLSPDLLHGRRAARRPRRDRRGRSLLSWGPGKFDAELFLDGKAFRPDGGSAATLIPPAFGLAGVNLHTWTGWGLGPALERVRRQPRDARQGPLLRPAAERRGAVPDRGGERLRQRESEPPAGRGPHHAEARGAASLPARDPRAGAAGRQLRRGRREARRRALLRQGEVQLVPRRSRSGRSPAGTCTPGRRSVSTTSRRTARPTAATGRRRSADSGRTRRAASTTTAASRRSSTSSTTTTRRSTSALTEQEKSDLVEYLKSLPDEEED